MACVMSCAEDGYRQESFSPFENTWKLAACCRQVDSLLTIAPLSSRRTLYKKVVSLVEACQVSRVHLTPVVVV
jgi:hypothetical protein